MPDRMHITGASTSIRRTCGRRQESRQRPLERKSGQKPRRREKLNAVPHLAPQFSVEETNPQLIFQSGCSVGAATTSETSKRSSLKASSLAEARKRPGFNTPGSTPPHTGIKPRSGLRSSRWPPLAARMPGELARVRNPATGEQEQRHGGGRTAASDAEHGKFCTATFPRRAAGRANRFEGREKSPVSVSRRLRAEEPSPMRSEKPIKTSSSRPFRRPHHHGREVHAGDAVHDDEDAGVREVAEAVVESDCGEEGEAGEDQLGQPVAGNKNRPAEARGARRAGSAPPGRGVRRPPRSPGNMKTRSCRSK